MKIPAQILIGPKQTGLNEECKMAPCDLAHYICPLFVSFGPSQ